MLYIMHYIKNPPDWLSYKKMTYIEKKSAKKSTNFLEKVFFKYEDSIFRESCK